MIYVGDALLAHAAGGCYICARGDSLVDTEVSIVGEGALVLCRGCIQAAAEAADLHLNEAAVAEMRATHAAERDAFSPERVAELEAEVAELREQAAANERVEKILEDIRTASQGPKTNRRPAR